MIADAIREVLAIHVQGAPAESISFGATVTIVCTTEIAAHRWRTFCPNGVLPRSLTPVQVVTMDPEAPAQAHPLGPDGFTCLAGDAAYDRLHGVDGHTQADTEPISRVQAIEAAEDRAEQVEP